VWSPSRPVRFTPEEKVPVTNGWRLHGVSPDAVEEGKTLVCRESNPAASSQSLYRLLFWNHVTDIYLGMSAATPSHSVLNHDEEQTCQNHINNPVLFSSHYSPKAQFPNHLLSTTAWPIGDIPPEVQLWRFLQPGKSLPSFRKNVLPRLPLVLWWWRQYVPPAPSVTIYRTTRCHVPQMFMWCCDNSLSVSCNCLEMKEGRGAAGWQGGRGKPNEPWHRGFMKQTCNRNKS
jgi:hypothetical protein